MKTKYSHIIFSIHLIVVALFFASFNQKAKAEEPLPSKSEIANKMMLVNDYWINENPDPGDNKWARAVYFIGNMAMYDMCAVSSTGGKYYDYANDWAIKWEWKLSGSIWYPNADHQTAGQTYIALHKYDPQPYKIKHIQDSIDRMVNRSKVDDWWWVDALFMTMPNFVELGNINNDTVFYDKMWDLYTWTKYSQGGNGLYSDNGNNTENDFLWWRDKNQTPPNLTSAGKNVYWSRGNGWVIAAMVKVLKALPSSDSHYDEYKQTLISMAGSLKDRQRPDGFWNVNLDDPNHYGGKETSGTAFFTYALAYGINSGILEAATYGPVVEKAWSGMVDDAVQANGFLGYIQGPGHRPESGQPVNASSTRDFGVGAFLLAGTEVVKMASGLMPDCPTTSHDHDTTSPEIHSQSSERAGNEAIKVIDGNTSGNSRWSANGFPQWVIVDMGTTPAPYNAINLWTYQNRAYQYIIWASDDLSSVQNEDDSVLIIDRSGNTSTTQPISDTTSGYPWRYVKLKVVGASEHGDNWVSINEIEMVQAPSSPSITLSINSSSMNEVTGTADLIVTLSEAAEFPVMVDLIYTGTATADVDYSKSDVITISAGNTFAQATLTAIDDALDEGNETITVTLNNPTNATLGTIITDTITITDDDTPLEAVIINQSAEQAGNEAIKVIDGNTSNDFRWSASGFPQWVIIDYGENKSIEGTELWTYQNRAYQYYVYASTSLTDVENEVVGSLIVDHSNNTSTSQPISSSFTTLEARYVKLKIVGASGYSGSWSSINEFKIVEGNSTDLNAAVLSLDFGIKQLQFSWPAVNNATYYRLMENPDGVSGFTQRGEDITTTSHTLDIAVHRQDWGSARYLLQACNSNLCSSSNEVSTLGGVLSAIGYVKASNNGIRINPTRGGDGFGRSVALSGDSNTLVVGARDEDSNARGISTDGTGEDNNAAFQSGAVYVFGRSGGSWDQQAYVKASNAEEGDWFGTSIALSTDGNTLAVGASLNFFGSGAVYVFSRNDSGWSEQAFIRASYPGIADFFGTSIALSSDGNTLVVGADGEKSNATNISTDGTGEDNSSAEAAGAVYVFTRNGGSWSQQAYVKASNAGAGDGFGASVDLSSNGNTLVVGAGGEDSNATGISTDGTGEGDNSAPGAGAVYVFSRSSGGWVQQAYVKASNTEAGDEFGGSVSPIGRSSVSLSGDGNTLVVGAGGEDSNATGISTDGTGEGDNSVSTAGAVYVFDRNNGSWVQQAYVKASNTEAGSRFGASVVLSRDNNTLAVGAVGESSSATGISTDGIGGNNNVGAFSGAVYVFSRNGGDWSQQTYVKASNTGAGDFFGAEKSVALSSDGNTLVVGAFGEEGNAIGITHGADAIGADNSEPFAGAVYLY